MTRRSGMELQRNTTLAQQADFNVNIWDGAEVAADEAWRAGPSMAIARGVQSAFDTSEKIPAAAANEKYGLAGTTAEIGIDEEVTEDDARARAADYQDIKMNSFITETVNEDSPVMGKVSQFVAGMAASMVDPTMIAANALGTGLIAKAGQSIAKGGRALNFADKLSPALAKGIVSSYAVGGTKSLMTVVAREGLENFAGSVIEESIAASVDIGQERLARKITTKERLTNIIAGTVFGTGLGTVMTKDGREAVGRVFSRQFGDDAGDMAQTMHTVSAEELKMGVEKSNIESKFYDRETFENRGWYNEPDVEVSNTLPSKLFIPVDKDGAVHNVSNRGEGVTLTGNKVHAYNKGDKVLEYDSSNLNLITKENTVDAKGRHTETGSRVMDSLVDDFVAGADPKKVGKIMALLADSEADIDGVNLNRNQVRKLIKEQLNGKHLDDMVDLLDQISARHGINYDPSLKLEGIVEELGFNGYSFTGKNAQGKPAYTGVYVNKNFSKKLAKTAEYETPKPQAIDKINWQNSEAKLLQEHAKWLRTEARSLKADIKDPQVAGIPKETPLETAPKTAEGQAMIGSIEKQAAFTLQKNKLNQEIMTKMEEAKAKQKPDAEGKATELSPEDVVDEETITKQKLMELIEKGHDQESIVKQAMDVVEKWTNCRLGF